MRSIKTSVNLHRILEFAFRNISLDKHCLAYSTDSGINKLPKGHFAFSEWHRAYERAEWDLQKDALALKEIWSLLPAVCSACNMHFFGHQVLILFWTHLPCFFSILSVCMPGLFCCILIGSDSILREVGAGAQKKNRAIKRFRNRAISNRDFISISINRTALLYNSK